MRKDIKLKPSVHEIWSKCVENNNIEHGHIKPKKTQLKKCSKCGHDLPLSYYNDNKDMCYYCEE